MKGTVTGDATCHDFMTIVLEKNSDFPWSSLKMHTLQCVKSTNV